MHASRKVYLSETKPSILFASKHGAWQVAHGGAWYFATLLLTTRGERPGEPWIRWDNHFPLFPSRTILPLCETRSRDPHLPKSTLSRQMPTTLTRSRRSTTATWDNCSISHSALSSLPSPPRGVGTNGISPGLDLSNRAQRAEVVISGGEKEEGFPHPTSASSLDGPRQSVPKPANGK